MGKALVFLLSGALAFALAQASALSQPAGRTVRVAVVLSEERASFRAAAGGFFSELARRGFKLEQCPRSLADAPQTTEAEADLVLALGTEAAIAASRSPWGPPVLFAVVGDPVGAGLAERDGRPRGRATGVAALPAASGQIALVRELVPAARRLAAVFNSGRSAALAAELRAEAEAAGLGFEPIAVRGPEEVAAALQGARDRIDAVLAVADPTVWNGPSVKAAVLFALRNKLALFGFSVAFTRAGAIASLSAEDFEDMGAQAGEKAAELLHGRPLAEILVAAPRRTTVSLNLVVARRIGCEPPRALVDRAGSIFR